MKKPLLFKLAPLLFLLFFVFLNSPSAQHFVSMTDQQWVELALDMIRKGIQQQDTTKILRVVSPDVSVKSEGAQPGERLSLRLQSVFNDSRQRVNRLQRPAFPRGDNPLHLSNLWDFDILDPKIEIEGDSAVVECELVLWGATPAKGSDRAGIGSASSLQGRAKERFVFRTPSDVEKTPPSGDYRKWPASSSGKKQKTSLRSWKLIRFEKLLDFLHAETNLPPKEKGER